MKTKYLLQITALIILLATIVFSFSSCSYSGYQGDHKGAYTLAYTQIPGTRGARYPAPNFADPSIIHLETDSEGRALYIYFESTEGPLYLSL